MWQKIVSFFMAIIAFFASLFGINVSKNPNVKIFKDLSYGTEQRQKLDLYLPKNAGGSTGLYLAIHGGAWISGDKTNCPESILYTVSGDMGFAAATMNYRYISEAVSVNDIMDDIDAALRAIKAKGKEQGVDIDRVMLTGYSAGAHLSLLYGYSRKDSAPMKIAFVASNSGPTNLADVNFYNGSCSDLGDANSICSLMSMACGKAFTPETFYDAVPALLKASPVSYVSPTCPPTLIAHGEKDSIVPYSNATSLDNALTVAGVKHDLVPYPNSNHGLESDKESAERYETLLFEYVNTYLK